MSSLYRLYDVYDGFSHRTLVGQYDTLREVKRAALHWDVEETDGECEFALYRLNELDGKYYLVEDWSY